MRLAAPISTLLILLNSAATAAAPIPVERYTPYLTGKIGQRARDQLATKAYGEAIRSLTRYTKNTRRDRPQAEFLLAYALLRQKEFARAEAIFERLTRSYALLGDYHRYLRASALYKLKRFSSAERVAREIGARSMLAVDAELLRADALRALHKTSEAAELWRNYLRRRPYGARVGEGNLRVAQALEMEAKKRPREAATLRQQAAASYRRAMVRAPLSAHAPAAARALTRLAAAAAHSSSPLSPALDADEIFAQSLVFFRKMRNVRAEKGFSRAISTGLRPPKDCRARYYRAKSVFKQRQRARAATLFDNAAKACRRQGETNFLVKSLYNHARGLYRKGQYRKSAEHFLALEREFSSHSYADDARLRAAEAVDELKRTKEVEKLLAAIPRRYPKGDMGREALWRLARSAYLAGDFPRALGRLDEILAMGRARVYYAEGRALYWKARIRGRQGDKRGAREHYERCLREYPLSYYALQAFNRLRESDPPAFQRLRKELLRPIGRDAGRWRFERPKLLGNVNFRRGVELARLGLGKWAGRELARAGLSTRRGTPNERLWLAAVLFHGAGLWHLSHQVPRSRDRRHQRLYPLGDNVRSWRISYPRAFAPLVKREARRNKIPPELVWAVMREESGFSRKLESYANAVGLMQMILPTARSAASYHRLRVDRKQLHKPEVNIRLGSTFLGFLSRTFYGRKPLIIAGYNAGHGAVYKWLKRFRRARLDELVEQIPYDQTRRYTKRVLASFFAYSVLHGKRRDVPRIPQRLPTVKRQSFGEKKKKGRR